MIFIDFDGVILNTKKFTLDLEKVYVGNGILKSEIKEYKKIISRSSKDKNLPYNPEKLIAYKKNMDKKWRSKTLASINIFLKNLKKYVFLDALAFLEKLPKDNLILISYGDSKFQKDKIVGSGTDKYFSKIIIDTENKIKLILKTVKEHKIKEKEKIFFIDDKLENLEKIEKMDRNIITIWLNRNEEKYLIQDRIVVDYVAKNLKEALKIINKLK